MSAEKKPSPKLIVLIVVLVVAVIGGFAYWYMNVKVPHDEAVTKFNQAVSGLENRNAELDQAVSDLQQIASGDDKPLDESTVTAASETVGQAQGAKEEAPEMPDGVDEINAAAEKVDGMGDYSEQLAALASAKESLENSIKQLKQVTNPSEQFVIQRITGLPNITGVEAATEANDPNGNLNKQGGYTAAVYFSSDLVDHSKLYNDGEYTGIVGDGTDGGGCVEVYANAEDAEKRDTYLGAFDGQGFLDSGSHVVLGTCVVRTSTHLTASQQQAITSSIKEALTRLE